jgi:hypothetical protein
MRFVCALAMCLLVGCGANEPPSDRAKEATKEVAFGITVKYDALAGKDAKFNKFIAEENDGLKVVVTEKFKLLSDEEMKDVAAYVKDRWEMAVHKRGLQVRFVNQYGDEIFVAD